VSTRIVILTGERGVGKSTVCSRTVALARAREYTCGGLITLSRSGDVRDALDVHSGDVRRLTVESGAGATVAQGRFRFDPETLAWGNEVLTHATPCHLLVVDELGPLEIERGEGWQKAFDLLRQTNFTLALVVVRPELVDELIERVRPRLPAHTTTVLTVTPHNRDDLPDALLKMLVGSLKSPAGGSAPCAVPAAPTMRTEHAPGLG